MRKNILIFVSILFFACPPLFASKIQDKLVDAVTEGSYKDIKRAFTRNYDYIEARVEPEGKSLLIFALMKDREFKIIKYIVKSGVKVNTMTKGKQNALMFACQYSSDPAVIEYLVKKAKLLKSSRAKYILKKDSIGENCFDYASKNENPEMVLEVLEKYAKNPYKEEVGEVEGDDAVEVKEEIETIPVPVVPTPKIIEEEVPVPEPPVVMEPAPKPVVVPPVPKPKVVAEDIPSEKFTDLDDFSKLENEMPAPPPVEIPETTEDIATSSVLFSLEGDDDASVPRKKSYLFEDSDLEEEGGVPFDDFTSKERTFIENANKKDKFGRTPLMIAAQKGEIEKIKDLLYSGADIQAKDNDGWTALMFAARYQTNPDVTELLMKSGAVVSTKNKHGITALNFAAGFNTNPMVLSVLLKNRSISEKEIRGAFVYAICSQAPIAVLNVFLKKGIQLNVSYDGKTPLMYAAENNDKTEILSWLLENGASIKLQTSRGMTAFDFATENTKLPRDGVYWALNGE